MFLFQENNTSLAHSTVNFDPDTKKAFLVSTTLRNQL